MKTCFFIGHHDAPEHIQEKINAVVEQLVEEDGVGEFVMGYHGNFDRMATVAVQKLKKNNRELKAYRLLAYHPAERDVQVPQYFDGTLYPPDMESIPRRFAIVRANQYMAEHCDYLIAYVRREGGNAARILTYAKRRGSVDAVKIINLAVKR